MKDLRESSLESSMTTSQSKRLYPKPLISDALCCTAHQSCTGRPPARSLPAFTVASIARLGYIQEVFHNPRGGNCLEECCYRVGVSDVPIHYFRYGRRIFRIHFGF